MTLKESGAKISHTPPLGKYLADPLLPPNICWLHCTLLTLLPFIQLHIIGVTLLLLSGRILQTNTAFLPITFVLICQLKINILEFHVLRHLERLVLLSLWRRDFFHVDPGYWVPACDGISGSVAFAISDPESHAYPAFVDLFTDAFYLTNSVQIFPAAVSVDHVDDSINGCWSWALCAVEGEIPPSAAGMTIVETKVPVVKDSQPGFCRLLVENAFLLKIDQTTETAIKKKTERSPLNWSEWFSPREPRLVKEIPRVEILSLFLLIFLVLGNVEIHTLIKPVSLWSAKFL